MRISDWSSDVCSSDLAQMAQTAHGLANDAKTGQIAVGAGLAVARYTQHDQFGVEGFQVFPAQPPAFQGSRLEVFDDDVYFLGQIGRASCRARVCQYV